MYARLVIDVFLTLWEYNMFCDFIALSLIIESVLWNIEMELRYGTVWLYVIRQDVNGDVGIDFALATLTALTIWISI